MGGVADAAREACLPVHDYHDEDVRRSQRWKVFETPSTPWVFIGRPMDPVRPRSAHRKRRLFLFLARPGSSMGGLHRPRVRRGKSFRAGPLLRRPAVPRRGLLVLRPCTVYRRGGGRCL